MPIYPIAGIDPGTNAAGVAFLHYDIEAQCVTHLELATIREEALYTPQLEDALESHGARFRRTQAVSEAIGAWILARMPSVVVCESPFYYRMQPGAFAPLVEVLYAIRARLYQEAPTLVMHTLEPILIKKLATGHAFAKKDEVLKALLSHPLLTHVAMQLTNASEHAIDATAVALAWIMQHKEMWQ